MLIIKTKWNNVDKKFLLSAFDLRPISKKNPKRIAKLKKGEINPPFYLPLPS